MERERWKLAGLSDCQCQLSTQQSKLERRGFVESVQEKEDRTIGLTDGVIGDRVEPFMTASRRGPRGAWACTVDPLVTMHHSNPARRGRGGEFVW